MTNRVMELPTPDPGTHWEFHRGKKSFTSISGYIPTFRLVESSTGKHLYTIYPDACLTPLGVWLDARRAIRDIRKAKRQEADYTKLEAQYPRRTGHTK